MKKNKGRGFFPLISVCSMCCVWWSALLHFCNYLLFCTRLITFVLQIADSCRTKKCLATIEFGISTNSDQKVEMKTFPVSTLSQGKYCLLYRESCPHYRNFPACLLFYLVQCSVSHEHVCYVGFHQRCMEKNIYTGHSSC